MFSCFQSWEDIDAKNMHDIYQVALYAHDIFVYYKEREVSASISNCSPIKWINIICSHSCGPSSLYNSLRSNLGRIRHLNVFEYWTIFQKVFNFNYILWWLGILSWIHDSSSTDGIATSNKISIQPQISQILVLYFEFLELNQLLDYVDSDSSWWNLTDLDSFMWYCDCCLLKWTAFIDCSNQNYI